MSMTESYDPYANAIAERVNGILKFLLEEFSLPFKLMKKVVKECIAIYNNQMPHYSCGHHTPDWMYAQDAFRIKNYKTKKSPQALACGDVNLSNFAANLVTVIQD